MTAPNSGLPEQSPAVIFIDLWRRACAWTPPQRSTATSQSATFKRRVDDALALQTAHDAYNELRSLLSIVTADEAAERGKVLDVMRAIDGFFYLVHPRSAIVVSPTATRPLIPDWLRDLRTRRRLTGGYGHDGDHRLIPRGPLVRRPRDEMDCNAESLADRFAALTVVPKTLAQEDRPVRIAHRVIGLDAAQGVPPGVSPGGEVVVFIPIAEQEADLVMSEQLCSGQLFVDYRVSPTLDPSAQFIDALCKAGLVDIAMAPEFVMPEDDADKLPDALMGKKDLPPRLVIAGSGPTRATAQGQPWNESRALNGSGAELWRQRKLWPAGLRSDRAKEFGLSGTGTGLAMENTAAGDEVVVADIDSLGRCVVLICQDVEARPLTDELIRLFQPDWVFVPVLDPGITIGRWVHQRTFNLSSISQARFLVASSTTLAHKVGTGNSAPCGLAVGPKEPREKEEGRLYATAQAVAGSSPGYAIVIWRSGSWEKTTVS
jgi:hypothetical protein